MSRTRHNSKPETQIPKLVPALLDWFAAHARDLPWRRTRDPYAIWVSEIMLQQTQVKTVIPYWERWMSDLPTIESLARARSEKIHKLWEGLGYYTRVRNLQKAAQQIVTQHAGRFPEKFDDVLALPGIGRYTAGAICSIAFNQPTPLLDGNVIRVLTRIFGISEDPKEKQTNTRLWNLATELVQHATRNPQHVSSCSHLNQSLMELGALICTPRNPQCLICPANQLCVARRDGLVEQLPNLGKRAPATERAFAAFIVERSGKFLVRQRPAGVVNAHLWEFPNEEIVTGQNGNTNAAFRRQNIPFHTVRHSITRYRITLTAFRATLATSSKKSTGRWLTLTELETLPFTSAHRKILRKLSA